MFERLPVVSPLEPVNVKGLNDCDCVDVKITRCHSFVSG